jgi:RNA polymerase sigma-70 factor (ECF subfamily)
MGKDRKEKDDSEESLKLYSLLQRNSLLIAKLLRRFSFSIADLEDITQETILRALEAREQRKIEHPRQFLIGIAKNVAREELRKRARITSEIMEDYSLLDHSSSEPSTEAIVDGQEKLRLFALAVSQLPPQCRKVFVLKHVYGKPHKAISKKLGISVSTVEKHVAHGLNACRQQMLAQLNRGADDDVLLLFDTATAGRREAKK